MCIYSKTLYIQYYVFSLECCNCHQSLIHIRHLFSFAYRSCLRDLILRDTAVGFMRFCRDAETVFVVSHQTITFLCNGSHVANWSHRCWVSAGNFLTNSILIAIAAHTGTLTAANWKVMQISALPRHGRRKRRPWPCVRESKWLMSQQSRYWANTNTHTPVTPLCPDWGARLQLWEDLIRPF